MTVRYGPGDWWAIVAGDTMVLLDAGAPAALAVGVWEAVESGGGFPEVLRALTAHYGPDFTALPPFAVAALRGTTAGVVARGEVTVRVRGAEGADVDGRDVLTWSERRVSDAVAIEILTGGGGGHPGGGLPLGAGVVRAGWVSLGADEPTSGDGGVEPAVEPASVAAVPVPAVPAVEPASVAAVPVLAVPAVEPEPAPQPVSQTQPQTPAQTPPEPQPQTPPEPESEPERTAEMTMVENPMDDLWRTRLTTVEDAAIRQAPEEVEPPRPEPSRPAPPIRQVPGIADPFADDHDGETILRSELAAIRGGGGAGTPPPPSSSPISGPSVLARSCAAGHPNPPEAGHCRTCGAPLTRDAQRVPRPSLGRAVLSTGATLELDAPAVLGRAPKVTRVAGGDMPRVVPVPSPTREISGTHLAIRLEEWHVLVTDLDSSNGTVLRRPGQPPQRLQPREPAMIRTGDVIDLGDGLVLTFEDIP